MKRLHQRAKRKMSLVAPEWDEYRAERKVYKNLIIKAKRQSWERFCEGVRGASAASKLNKLLSKNPNAKLTRLEVSDGVFTETKLDTYNHLLETHFPGSEPLMVSMGHSPGYSNVAGSIPFAECESITVSSRVKWAINMFDPYKAPGADSIIPAMLQHANEQVIITLSAIYRACLNLGYIPQAWRTSR